MEHLVYCDAKSKVLDKLYDGRKTMIIRGAAGRKLPYGRVFEGDALYFVENDGSQVIKAKGTVSAVINSEALSPEESVAMIVSHGDALSLSPAQEKRFYGKKRLCLVSVKDVVALGEPLPYDRQKNMDDWITVESINDVLEGQSKTYQSLRFDQ